MKIKDMLQRELTIISTPQRIVSLVPSQTELLVYLGLENSLVGITKFCVHPGYLKKEKKIVGGTKKVHFDKIIEVNPDIILCNKEENTPEMIEELEKIAPVHVSDIITFSDALYLIDSYGKIFNIEEKADGLQAKISKKRTEFIRSRSLTSVKVAYFIWRKPWMVVGGDTFINSMLQLNSCVNVFEDSKERYPEIRLEELNNKNIDLLLLSSEPFPFKEKHLNEIQEICDVPVLFVDGEYFSWYGSRLLPAFDYFEKFQKLASNSL